jgi:hypothetical protein
MSFTDGATIADKVVRARNSSSHWGDRVTIRPYAGFVASQVGAKKLSTAERVLASAKLASAAKAG